jgi:hypothetical protein
MKYGELPHVVDNIQIECEEMLFYQYIPIKMVKSDGLGNVVRVPLRLECFNDLIVKCIDDFVNTFGLDEFKESFVYLTAKKSYQDVGNTFNRFGYHSDGFLTNDINYIWSDNNGTVFNNSKFNLTLNDEISLKEMNEQAIIWNDIEYNDCDLIRLNQFNIHKVKYIIEPKFRTFFKLSFSKDKYDLKGNSHNYQFKYNWKMRERKESRNIPQQLPTLVSEARSENS